MYSGKVDRATFDAGLLQRPGPFLQGLVKSGELAGLFPEVYAMVGFGGSGTQHKDLWWHTKLVVSQCPANVRVRWAALFHDVGKVQTFEFKTGRVTFHGHEALSGKLFRDAAKRTGWFNREERVHIRGLIHNLGHIESYELDWTDSAVRRLHKLAGDRFEDLVALASADITTKHEDKRSRHHKRMADLVHRAKALAALDATPAALPTGLGDILMAELGLGPSKELGAVMGRLKAAVEAGDLPRSAEPEVYLAWLRKSAT